MSLEDIRAREQAATKGPWVSFPGYGASGEGVTAVFQEEAPGWIAACEPDQQGEWDAEFIAHARTDIPFLLDERDKLRAALDAVRERLERLEKVAKDHVQSPDSYTSGIGQGLWIAAGSVGLAIDEALR